MEEKEDNRLVTLQENRRFGMHPDWDDDFQENIQEHGSFFEEEVCVEEFFNPQHPEVYLIPRERDIHVVDTDGDSLALETVRFPFSSFDFYVDTFSDNGVFPEFRHPALFRLGDVNQLGYLVLPKDSNADENVKTYYISPVFLHSRWIHSLSAAILAEVVLARNGFSERERLQMVLTTATHDIATPAGGDSVKRIDKENLDEEKSYSWVMKYHGLDKEWKAKYGFDLEQAQRTVLGEGEWAKFLDIVDKISYTTLDCYAFGSRFASKIRTHCIEHPLVMDVWQDIKFVKEEGTFAFTNPERLYNFLLLRTYEFQELLFESRARTYDSFLGNLTSKLYPHTITREDLLTQNDSWLEMKLKLSFPDTLQGLISPDELTCQKFNNENDFKEFCAKVGNRLHHTDILKGFSTGIDFPVIVGDKIVKLEDILEKEKKEYIQSIANSTKGYYVYYK